MEKTDLEADMEVMGMETAMQVTGLSKTLNSLDPLCQKEYFQSHLN